MTRYALCEPSGYVVAYYPARDLSIALEHAAHTGLELLDTYNGWVKKVA